MGIATLALAALIASADAAAQNDTKLCYQAAQMRDVNIPAAPATPATDITHATVIFNDSRPIGYIYVLRNTKAWYQDGPITAASRDSADASKLLSLLSLQPSKKAGLGTLYPLKSLNVLPVLSAGYGLHSCF